MQQALDHRGIHGHCVGVLDSETRLQQNKIRISAPNEKKKTTTDDTSYHGSKE
jgi:hypothetical protein